MKRYKNILIGLGVILLYFLYTRYILYLPLSIANVNIASAPFFLKIIYYVAGDIFLISIICLIYKDTLISNFKDFKKNFSSYIDIAIRYWIVGLVIMAISSLIITYGFTKGIPANEQAVRTLIKVAPYYMLFSASIYAPIVEELTFRKSVFNIFGRNTIAAIISGILFGSVHVIFSATTLVEYLQIIPYSAVGLAFAFMYKKTNNIFLPIVMHFAHNFIFALLQVVLFI